MHARRLSKLVLAVVAGVATSGCALFSETRQKQGQELTDAWAKVDLATQVAAPRKNRQALLDQQLKLEEELWSFSRSRIAEQMVATWTVGALQKHIGTRIEQVAGTPGQVASAAAAASSVADAKKAMAPKLTDLALVGGAWPGCEAVPPGPARDKFEKGMKDRPEKGLVLAALDAFKGPCEALAAAEAQAKPGGELGTAAIALAAERAARQADSDKLKVAQAAFNEAKETYEKEAAALVAAPSSSRGKLDEAIASLKKSAESLGQLDSSLSVAVVSEERLASINKFIANYEDVVAGKGTPEGSSRAAIALGLFPDLIDKTRQTLLDAQKPSLVPLVLQKKVEQAKLEAAQRDLARRDQMLALRQQRVAILTERLETYQRAEASLKGALLSPVAGARLGPLLAPAAANADLASTEQKRKNELHRVASLVLDAEGRLQAASGKARYQIAALAHEEATSYAESSLMQWKALLDPSVELLVAYGDSGLKASQIQDLLNTIALLVIAARTN